MEGFDLLSAVQPNDGWCAVVGIKDGAPVEQVLVESREEVETVTAALTRKSYNTFFGVAKYKDGSSRTKQNVLALKSFWVDIDCGENKPYQTQNEGLMALQSFCRATHLPKPIIVDSGRGLHAYWPLTESIAREEWERAATRLRTLCTEHDLMADPACFEAARILRIPGTYNFKGQEPVPVTVLAGGKPIDYATLKELLGVKDRPEFEIPQGGGDLSPLAQMLRDNMENSFDHIIKRTPTCAHIAFGMERQDEVSEPHWFSLLSVAKFCKDRDTALHIVSNRHPDYSYERTEAKAEHILGPHTCAEFEKHNPQLCKKCPFKGKIKSPIQLGRRLKEEDDEKDETDEEQDEAREGRILVDEPRERMPDPPFPYKRGVKGGIYRMPAAEEAEPELVFEEDIWVAKRMLDPKEGGMMLVKYQHPQDGLQQWIMSNKRLLDPQELRKELASKDVLGTEKQLKLLTDYMMKSSKNLISTTKAELMRKQFGWHDDDKVFILGDKEYSKEATRFSPPSSITEAMVPLFEPKGTFEKWKEVFDLYGREGYEAHAFAAGIAFGAPLFKFTGHAGVIINMIHPNSGTGKSTILRMCNSVYGHPAKLMFTDDDTYNAKITKMGIHNHLPVTLDEMTNTTSEELSALVYQATQGRGKDRMLASTNELRINDTTWQTMCLSSANASFYDKLGERSDRPDGELMRIMEFHLDHISSDGSIDVDYGRMMFDNQLMENYGHAGPRYITFLMRNKTRVLTKLAEVQKALDTAIGARQSERFWTAAAASVITGCIAAKEAGLHNWDVGKLFTYACNQIIMLRATCLPPPATLTCVNFLGGVLNKYLMNNTLAIKGATDGRSKTKIFTPPSIEPRGDIIVRAETDTKRLFVAKKAFKQECTARRVSYSQIIKELEACGIFVQETRIRLTKGYKLNIPPVEVLEFNGDHEDFNLDSHIEAHGPTEMRDEAAQEEVD